MKKSIIFSIFLALSLIFLSNSVNAEDKSLEIKIDSGATIFSNEPTKNTSEIWQVSHSLEGANQRLYLKIPAEKIQKNIEVKSAFLTIEIEFCDGVSSTLYLGNASSSWNVPSINWTNKSGYTSPTSKTQLDCLNRQAKWDVLEQIDKISNSNSEFFGFVVYGEEANGSIPFTRVFAKNSENTKLVITYEELGSVVVEKDSDSNNRTVMIILLVAIVAALIITVGLIIKFFIFDVLKKKKLVTKKDKETVGTLNLEESKDVEEKVENKIEAEQIATNSESLDLVEEKAEEAENVKSFPRLTIIPEKSEDEKN